MTALPTALDRNWCDDVESFWVDSESDDLNQLQRDGATAVIDLAHEYQSGRGCENRELAARTLGRLSDIQVRDFALGSHTDETADAYWQMWSDLLASAPERFIAPVACLVAAMAYERGEQVLAHLALDRAIGDDGSYSLALLLRRVFLAGWPAESFRAMRSELHPKVVAGIFS